MKTRTLHSIHTFMASTEDETILIGRDENGKKTTLVFSTIDLLSWLDIDYMKEQTKKYINNL